MIELSLLGTDELITEVLSRSDHGFVYLLKRNGEAYKYKQRVKGSPVVRRGALEIMRMECQRECEEAEEMSSDEF